MWYAMYGGDTRDRWRADLLTDRRVTHWWDERRVVGRRLLDDVGPHQALRAPGSREFDGPVLWDAYLLFDRTARWDASPSGLVRWGYTILAAREALDRDVASQLQMSSSGVTR